MPTRAAADASASKLGYLYQCRYALSLALKRGDDLSLSISLESVDDIAVHESQRAGRDAAEALQLKHKIDREGGTTNSHKDIWNSLKNWAVGIRKGILDPKTCSFLLITTATASDSHAVRWLRADRECRDTEKARLALEAATANSKSQFIIECSKQIQRLSLKKRKALFAAITLVEASPRIDEIRTELERQVWMAVSKELAAAFIERLEGWWFDQVINHLIDENSHSIPLSLVRSKIASLRDQFRNDNLPDDLLHEDVPDQELSGDDPRIFVQQLRHIGVGSGRIRKAQENYFKAASQRSRWIRDKMVDMDEIDRFELNLIEEWDESFTAVNDGLAEAEESILLDAAVKLYEWSQSVASSNPTLFIRPLFRSAYLTRGSYQMLAEQVRVGWHQEFQQLFQREA